VFRVVQKLAANTLHRLDSRGTRLDSGVAQILLWKIGWGRTLAPGGQAAKDSHCRPTHAEKLLRHSTTLYLLFNAWVSAIRNMFAPA